MTYDPNIPNDLPSPSISVDAIRTNFSQYDQVFDNNHAALNGSNQGKHTHVIFQQQSDDPNVEGGFDTLYGKSSISNLGTFQSVFAKIPQFLPNQQPNTPMQMFFNSVNSAGPQYQSFLPGGYVLYFGQATQVPGPNVSIVITLSPIPTEIVCVIANSTNIIGNATFWGQPIAVKVLSSSQFQINPTGTVLSNKTIPWIAIAKQ